MVFTSKRSLSGSPFSICGSIDYLPILMNSLYYTVHYTLVLSQAKENFEVRILIHGEIKLCLAAIQCVVQFLVWIVVSCGFRYNINQIYTINQITINSVGILFDHIC